jgi:16S rRNA (uracil1498-N3)-methyltransferase
MHRFYFEDIDKDSEFIKFSKNISHQIINVLRMKNGDSIEVFNGKGLSVIAQIDIDNKNITAKAISKKNVFESELKIDVYQSIIKNSKLELIIEKLTELGISSFTPLITERSQKKDVISLSENKINRLRKICVESAEQSGKFFIPEIRNREKFVDMFNDRKLNNPIIFYENRDESEALSDVNLDLYKNSTLSIFIGPVGGFSRNEINLSRNSGANIINIGETILKSDTAAIVSCALLRYLIENNLS